METPKVIKVMQKILANPNSIQMVLRYDSEYFFRYNSKTFSILYGPTRDDEKYGHYSFYVYPFWDNDDMKNLAVQSNTVPMEEPDMVTFHSSHFPTQEAQSAFEGLYSLLQRKFNKVEDLFDELLSE